MDRLLGLNYKPPITGRYFSNHQLFAFNDTDPEFRALRLHQPTFFVPVALVAWVDNLKSVAPSYENIGKVLLMRKDPPPPVVPISDSSTITNDDDPLDLSPDLLEQIRRVSNIIAFDFILDDHDRKNLQNWKQVAGLFITWDSGLWFDPFFLASPSL